MIAPSEKHLEDWLVSRNGCPIDAPSSRYVVVGRQVRLHSGRADLIVFNGSSLLVYELKKDAIDVHALAQILRYQSDLRDIWRIVCKPILQDFEQQYALFPFCVSGMLIGRTVSRDVNIAAAAANVVVYTYDFDGTTYHCQFVYELGMSNLTAEEFAFGRIGEWMRQALTAYFDERSETYE